MPNKWFDVDKEGLGKIVAARGKSYVINELAQNSWDQNITAVDIRLRSDGNGMALLEVEDDDPEGFLDLALSHTLFGESPKKSNPEKRGRFNLGEKLVLAIASEASIISTKGCVMFEREGIRRRSNKRREKGTLFSARIHITKEELDDVILHAKILLPPKGVTTRVNGEVLPYQTEIRSFETSLPTIMSDELGYLKNVMRKTSVALVGGTTGSWLYEMGIPVMEIDLPWSVNVGQRIPLGMSRESVPESFMSALRVSIVNSSHDLLDENASSQAWVKAATSDKRVLKEAFEDVIKKRHGMAIIESPFDRDANIEAGERGYNVLGRGSLTPGERERNEEFSILPTTSQTFGKLSGTMRPPLELVCVSDWTKEMRSFSEYVTLLAKKLMKVDIEVQYFDNRSHTYMALYHYLCNPRKIQFNIGRAIEYKDFWSNIGNNLDQDTLIIHEFGHEYGEGHRDVKYYDAVASLGAKLKHLALNEPKFFEQWKEI